MIGIIILFVALFGLLSLILMILNAPVKDIDENGNLIEKPENNAKG